MCLRTVESGYGLCGLFVPGNRQAVVGTKGGALELFDVGASSLIKSVDAHTGAVWSIAADPKGTGFVSASADHDVKVRQEG
jgi:U3 small nucleolar RNA-associated protein 12